MGRGGRRVDRPVGVVVPQHLVHLVAAQEQDVVVGLHQPGAAQHRAQLLDLAPDHRHGPVLDVEVVVLDVGEHHPGQPELAVEGLPVLVGGQQVAVLGHDPVALGPDRLDRPGDVLAGLEAGDVVLDEAVGDLGMVAPDLVEMVEAAAGGEVEPGVLHFVPGGLPAGPGLAIGVQRHVVGVVERPGDAQVDGQAGQALELLVGPEQVDVHAGHHLGDAQVGDRRERLLAEPEEVQVGGVAEVEELEVVLPGQQDQVLEPVVLRLQLVAGAPADPVGDHRQVLHLRQSAEVQRLDLGDGVLDLHQPPVVQVVPVAEVEAGPLHELRHPGPDPLRIDAHRRQVRVAVQHSEVHAVGGRDAVVAAVHLAQRRQRDLHEGRVPRGHGVAPVHRVPEPEAVLLVVAAGVAEAHRIRVELLPALHPLGALDLEGAREPALSHFGFLLCCAFVGCESLDWRAGI